MERTVVLGGTGILGLALTRELARRGLAHVAPSRAELDLEVSGFERDLERLDPSAVINAAAYTDVGAAEQRAERDAVYRLNREVPGALATCCRRLRLPLVHVSTDYVFDGAKRSPYLEHDAVAPLQVYGQSKLDGERLVLERHPGALIVRTSTLFGAGRAMRPHYVSAILRQAREGRRIEVVKLPVASPTYSIDLANAIVDLLRCATTGIVHGSNRGGCSRLDLAREIVRLAGGEGVEVHERSAVAGGPARPVYSVLDTTKFSAVTGRQMPSWQDGLARYLASSSAGSTADESSAR